MSELIDSNNLADFQSLSENDMLKKLKQYSHQYYNEQPTISDEIFDSLVEIYKILSKKEYTSIGSLPPSSDVKNVQLPVFMPSLNKIKDDKALSLWYSKKNENNSNEYIITNKIDGMSCLIVKYANDIKLYTRGNGKMGTDITQYKKYLDLPILPQHIENVIIRGEFVLSKNKFNEKYPNSISARNTLVGIINSKKIDKQRIQQLSHVQFVAYELIVCNNEYFCPSKQMELLKDMLYIVPEPQTIYSILNKNELTEIYKRRKATCEYDIDGLVLSKNLQPCNIKDRKEENPKNTIAFKVMGDTVQAIVKNIEWNASKHGILKPVVIIDPVNLSGGNLSRLTAFNAKFVLDNNLGINSIITIIRSGEVIPYIVSVDKSTTALFPEDKEYIWNETKVDIKLVNNDIEVTKKRIESFFKKLEAKYIGPGIVKNLVENGYDTLSAIISLKPGDISKLQGFGEKGSIKIYSSIQQSIQDKKISVLMDASGLFGIGIGEKKIKIITDLLPNILENTDDDLLREVVHSSGMKKLAPQFINGLQLFKKWLHDHPEIIVSSNKVKPLIELNEKSSKFNNKKFLFTGKRNKQLEEEIQNKGGIISKNLTNDIDYLIVPDHEYTSSKVVKANESDHIKILTHDSLKNEL